METYVENMYALLSHRQDLPMREGASVSQLQLFISGEHWEK